MFPKSCTGCSLFAEFPTGTRVTAYAWAIQARRSEAHYGGSNGSEHTGDSTNFPTTAGAFQTSFGGNRDAFVTKLNPTGSALVYSTYLGGSRLDQSRAIAVDAQGSAYVTGSTESTDFPTTPGAFFQTAPGAFVTKVNPSGTGLIYSTYLGGQIFGQAYGVAVDALPSPNAYVTGSAGAGFPTTAGAFQTTASGERDAFVAKIVDITLPPGATSGEVSGGGTIDASGGIGSFGFDVLAQVATGQISGDLQYVDHATAAKLHSVAFTSFAIVGNTARFSGTCTRNGTPCTFEVNVTDNGEPGDADAFTISVSTGPIDGGTLRGGNIVIQP